MDEAFRKARDQVKNMLEQFYEAIDMIEETIVKMSDDENVETGRVKSAFQMELLSYLGYLAASDGRITRAETDLIEDLMGIDLRPAKLKQVIEENDIYSVEFETRAPKTLEVLVEIDNMLYRNHLLGDNSVSTAELYLQVFDPVGTLFIWVEGEPSEQALADHRTYNRMLRQYLSEHLDQYEDSVTISNKKKGAVVELTAEVDDETEEVIFIKKKGE